MSVSTTSQGTTPILVFSLVDSTGAAFDIDLANASAVYVTLSQGANKITKTNDELTISGNVVYCELSQSDSIVFSYKYPVDAEVNWVYSNGMRGASKIKRLPWARNLERRVL